MCKQETARHVGLIALLLICLTWLHYISPSYAHGKYHLEIVFQRLYFLPIVLACIWFDLAGGLCAFLAVLFLLVPHMISHWSWTSPENLTRLMQIVVYFVIALVLGKTVGMQKREQIKAKRAESLAEIGKSLSALAHDMRTPLIAIGGFANLIKRRHFLPENPDRDKIDIIISETARLECMVKDMLDFAKPLVLNRTQVNVQSLLEECVVMVEPHAGVRKVSVQPVVTSGLSTIYVDQLRIRQALINLLTNAVQASSEGEKVTVRCFPKSNSVCMDIIDCGCGITPQLRETVFSPFFTTKRDGTGLGLPIAKKIVDAHEGMIEIIDNPSRGLTFRMIIPNREHETLRRTGRTVEKYGLPRESCE